MNSLLVMTRAASVISDEQKQALVHDLIECKAKLFDQSKAMKQLKEAHEVQLVAVSRQLLELECGLRKRERELCAFLQQRDRKIMEQSHIIRFLTKKTGKTKTKIRSLADEAAAKIPQWSSPAATAVDQVLEKTKGSAIKAVTPHQPGGGGSAVTQITPGGGKSNSKKPVETSSAEVTLSSIMESEESENDSAVILDELASPTSKSSSSGCVSRSVSDVMSSEAELEKTNLPEISPFASPNYRGFLLRHGSYERYKIRSRMQQIGHAGQPHHDPNAADTTSKEIYQEYSNQVTANATLPRNRKHKNRKAEQRELLDSRQTSLSAQDLSQSVTKAPNISNATTGTGNGVSGTGNTTTVIVINGCNNNNSSIKSSQNGQINAINSANSNNNTNIEASSTHCKAASNSHRTVTKPRDVKNKSNNRTSKMQILKTSTTSTTMTTTVRQLPDDCKPPSPPPMGSHLGSPMIVTSDKFIQQSGSVYCSLYGIDMSEDELSYA